jgi:hypothetical protein
MPEDMRIFVRDMIERGVFQKVDPQRLAADRAELILACFDMHRAHDLIGHHRMLGGTCRCCAPLTYPGGALVIAEHSPLAICDDGYRVDIPVISAIRLAVNELGVERVSPYVHFPCLAAKMCGMTYEQILQTQFAGMDRLCKAFPTIDVAMMAHIDWLDYPEAANKEMTTYKVSRRRFNSCVSQPRASASAA